MINKILADKLTKNKLNEFNNKFENLVDSVCERTAIYLK